MGANDLGRSIGDEPRGGLWGLASVTCLLLAAGSSGLAGLLNDGHWAPAAAGLAAAGLLAVAAAGLALAGRMTSTERR